MKKEVRLYMPVYAYGFDTAGEKPDDEYASRLCMALSCAILNSHEDHDTRLVLCAGMPHKKSGKTLAEVGNAFVAGFNLQNEIVSKVILNPIGYNTLTETAVMKETIDQDLKEDPPKYGYGIYPVTSKTHEKRVKLAWFLLTGYSVKVETSAPVLYNNARREFLGCIGMMIQYAIFYVKNWRKASDIHKVKIGRSEGI